MGTRGQRPFGTRTPKASPKLLSRTERAKLIIPCKVSPLVVISLVAFVLMISTGGRPSTNHRTAGSAQRSSSWRKMQEADKLDSWQDTGQPGGLGSLNGSGPGGSAPPAGGGGLVAGEATAVDPQQPDGDPATDGDSPQQLEENTATDRDPLVPAGSSSLAGSDATGGEQQESGEASEGAAVKEAFVCERSGYHSDSCVMKGDVRIEQRSNLVVLVAQDPQTFRGIEKIRPYARKWDPACMELVWQFTLRSVDASQVTSRIETGHAPVLGQGQQVLSREEPGTKLTGGPVQLANESLEGAQRRRHLMRAEDGEEEGEEVGGRDEEAEKTRGGAEGGQYREKNAHLSGGRDRRRSREQVGVDEEEEEGKLKRRHDGEAAGSDDEGLTGRGSSSRKAGEAGLGFKGRQHVGEAAISSGQKNAAGGEDGEEGSASMGVDDPSSGSKGMDDQGPRVEGFGEQDPGGQGADDQGSETKGVDDQDLRGKVGQGSEGKGVDGQDGKSVANQELGGKGLRDDRSEGRVVRDQGSGSRTSAVGPLRTRKPEGKGRKRPRKGMLKEGNPLGMASGSRVQGSGRKDAVSNGNDSWHSAEEEDGEIRDGGASHDGVGSGRGSQQSATEGAEGIAEGAGLTRGGRGARRAAKGSGFRVEGPGIRAADEQVATVSGKEGEGENLKGKARKEREVGSGVGDETLEGSGETGGEAGSAGRGEQAREENGPGDSKEEEERKREEAGEEGQENVETTGQQGLAEPENDSADDAESKPGRLADEEGSQKEGSERQEVRAEGKAEQLEGVEISVKLPAGTRGLAANTTGSEGLDEDLGKETVMEMREKAGSQSQSEDEMAMAAQSQSREEASAELEEPDGMAAEGDSNSANHGEDPYRLLEEDLKPAEGSEPVQLGKRVPTSPIGVDPGVGFPEWYRLAAPQWAKWSSLGYPPGARPLLLDELGRPVDTEGHWQLFPEPAEGSAPGESELPRLECDVRHRVPAVLFSTGGYVGNVYHEFADGLVPLYATVQPYLGEVQLVLAEWHYGWLRKFGAVLAQLSKYPPLLLGQSREVHCFPEIRVGLCAHGEYAIDPAQMPAGEGIRDFQKVLAAAFRDWPFAAAHAVPLEPSASGQPPPSDCDPLLTLVVRSDSRQLLNLPEAVQWAQEAGFAVRLLSPGHNTAMEDVWAAVQETDVLLGVHGAGLTHWLFLRPGAVFIQIVPLALAWPAQTYFGEPAKALGVQYIEYNISVGESSLVHKYAPEDPILTDPSSMWRKGYQFVKEVYMDGQDVVWSRRHAKKVLKDARRKWLRARFRLEVSARDRRCRQQAWRR